jgi:hypothetical protein
MSAKNKAAAQHKTDAAADVVTDQETHPNNTLSPYAAQLAWRKRNPQAHWAHLSTQTAIRHGLLVPEPCEVCGETKVDAHHSDYNRPLVVRWLCRKHHKALHAAEKSQG